MYPQRQSSSTGKRRGRKYARAQAALPAPAGRVGEGSTRASDQLIADLRALTNAGLIEPFLDGGTIRYAVVDANEEDPNRPFRDGEPQMGNRDERLLLAAAGLALIAGGHKLLDKELGELGAPHVVGAVLVALALRS